MKYEFNLSKMRSEYATPIRYYLHNGSEEIYMNDLIGKRISIKYLHQINCVSCGKITRQSYMNGHCYNCFMTLPECDPGIFNPEEDKAHLGIARDMESAKKFSLVDHYVYLAYTGEVKVGVANMNNIPTRWIDQGAVVAIKFAKTPNRNLAGQIEVEMKKYLADKTNWRRMLMFSQADVNLVEYKKQNLEKLPDYLRIYESFDDSITELYYPYKTVANLRSVSLEKTDSVEGVLVGIKAQYLIFENGTALNVRTHSGYKVVFECED